MDDCAFDFALVVGIEAYVALKIYRVMSLGILCKRLIKEDEIVKEKGKDDAYTSAGVQYGGTGGMDAFKVEAQRMGMTTEHHLERFGVNFVPESRGESVQLIEFPDHFLAKVLEGIGTKTEIIHVMSLMGQKASWADGGWDLCASIFNDLLPVGASPMALMDFVCAGSAQWFHNKSRCEGFLQGVLEACNHVGAAFLGGETQTNDLVRESQVVLAGSVLGIIKPKGRLIRGNIAPGDAILFLESTGPHTNAFTLLRELAQELPDGYLTRVADNLTYGEALLMRSHIYTPIIDACITQGIEIHYVVPITGHGFLKLMRPKQPFTYVINMLPGNLAAIFPFVIENHATLDEFGAYKLFNMGAGCAIYLPERYVDEVIRLAIEHSVHNSFRAGVVQAGEKKVVIEPLGISYTEDDMQIRQ